MKREPPPAIPTRVALATWDDNRFCGYSVRDELAGRKTSWSALSLAVGHRALSDSEAVLLDDIVVCSLAADPRIWPLKIVRLLSAYGHTTVATAAGMLCTERANIGWRAYTMAARFLLDLEQTGGAAARRTELERRLLSKEVLPGYGVAFRKDDERATALRRCVEQRQSPLGRYWALAHEVHEQLAPKGIGMNMGAAGAGLMLDLGFDATQLEALGPYLVYPNYLANAVEGAAQAPAFLRSIPSAHIEDASPPPRRSPRATQT